MKKTTETPRKKRINPMIIEAVLQTVQASEEPLRVEHICQKNRWINGIGSIQSAAKILEEQGLIKVTRYCGYSIYERISNG